MRLTCPAPSVLATLESPLLRYARGTPLAVYLPRYWIANPEYDEYPHKQ